MGREAPAWVRGPGGHRSGDRYNRWKRARKDAHVTNPVHRCRCLPRPARRAGWPVVIAGNSTQNLERRIRRDDPRDPEHARRGFWVGVLDVSVDADSADFAIVARLSAGDVVVTQDIGLASMVLGRGAAAISVRGHVFRKETIDMELFVRHEEKKVRRAGGRTRGPAAFSSEDRRRFRENLTRLLG